MARPYGQKLLLQLEKTDKNTLGIQLAKLCIKANLPAYHVATVLEVSPTTIHLWFRGRGVRENKRKAVEVFIDLLKEDFANGVLPVQDTKAAVAYINGMVGVSAQ